MKCRETIFSYLNYRMFLILIVSFFYFLSFSYSSTFQMEWDSITISPETWTQINTTNVYSSPIVVATPEYTSTTNPNGISVWVTNVTSSSFLVRTSDENFNAQDIITVHYIVIEEGTWSLPGSGIQVEAGQLSTNRVGFEGVGNWVCPTNGEVISFSSSFTNNPYVASTRGSNNNPSAWANTFQNDPADENQPVPVDEMCIGLSQSKAISPGTITSNETIYWLAADEGDGDLGGVEFEILWNEQDTGDSAGNWINGYADAIPFTQSWAHTWIGTPDIIIASQTSVGGVDGAWPVIYDTGNTASIRMFVDEANERSHTGSESGGGWAFDTSGSIGNSAPNNININFTRPLILRDENNTINATITDLEGNSTVVSAIATINGPNSTVYPITLNPQSRNISINTGDLENSTQNYTAISSGDIIGEAGSISLQNRESKLINLTQTYNSKPVIIAIPATQNNDESAYIPIIHSINTTQINISLCRDNGATTCDNSYAAEDVHYMVFDPVIANNYSWMDIGRVNVTTNGVANSFSFSSTFSNIPYVFGLPQTYNISTIVSDGIAAHSWFPTITTTGADIVGCDHDGIVDSCAGTAVEEFGYVAIDTTNENFSKFNFGTQSIGDSDWTPIAYTDTFSNPIISVMVNSENGGEDPKYPWARSVTSLGADIRYCEQEGANSCDTHNNEDTMWIVFEEGEIAIGNGGDDIEKNLTIVRYNEVFSDDAFNITSLNITLNVTQYNNSGSLDRGNNDPNLLVEFDTTSSWQEGGSLNINSSGLYSLDITNPNILRNWSNFNSRNIRISGVNFDYSSNLKDIIEFDEVIIESQFTQYTGNWQSPFTNTSQCGTYNLTSLNSTDEQGAFQLSNYSTINFTIPCNPIITLLTPLNNSKLITQENVNFTFRVESDESILNCTIIINSVENQTIPCNSTQNTSLLINLEGGYYNWTINASDSNNVSSLADEFYFYNILDKYFRIEKTITLSSTNIYEVNISTTNFVNASRDITIFDFVDEDFTAGSLPPFSTFSSIIGFFTGLLYEFNITTPSLATNSTSYAISPLNENATLIDNFIVGAGR